MKYSGRKGNWVPIDHYDDDWLVLRLQAMVQHGQNRLCGAMGTAIGHVASGLAGA